MPKRPSPSTAAKPSATETRALRKAAKTISDAPAPTLDEVEGRRPKPSANDIMLTTEIATRFIGRSDRTLRTWKSQKGCPVPDGGITAPEHIAAIFEWWGEQNFRDGRREADAVLDPEGGMSTEQIERQTAMVKLQLEELKLGEKMGYLLPKEPYVQVLSMLLSDISSLIRSQSSQIATQLAGESDVRDVRKILDRYNDKMLKKLTVDEAMNIKRIDLTDEDDRFVEGEDVEG